ncbi:hypothetical protein ABFS82_04G106600 [Erythranthe guttata]
MCRGRWCRIECMPDFHVVSLSFGALSDNTAFPTCDPTRSYISPSITKLRLLRTLFFYCCFSDNSRPIPSFLGQLGPSLQTLVLREIGHFGPIPHELGNLTRLTVLDLPGNNLNGSIPVSLGRITGLRSLDLSCNRLSGSIPNISFPALNVLDLNQNHLMGPLPIPLLSTTSLMKIDLSQNQISGQIPNLNNLEDLVLFDLSYNALTGPFPKSLNGLKSLQVLILNINPFTSTIIPDNAVNWPAHKITVPLNGNQLNGTIPFTFSNLNGLSELKLNNNKLTGPVPFRRERVWRKGRKLSFDPIQRLTSSLFLGKTQLCPSLRSLPSLTPSAASLPLFVHHRRQRPPPLCAFSSSTAVADALAAIKSSSKDALPKFPTPISSSITTGLAAPMSFHRFGVCTTYMHQVFAERTWCSSIRNNSFAFDRSELLSG